MQDKDLKNLTLYNAILMLKNQKMLDLAKSQILIKVEKAKKEPNGEIIKISEEQRDSAIAFIEAAEDEMQKIEDKLGKKVN